MLTFSIILIDKTLFLSEKGINHLVEPRGQNKE